MLLERRTQTTYWWSVSICVSESKGKKAWDVGWGPSVGEQEGREGTGRNPTEPPSPNRIFVKTSVGEGHYKTRTQMVRVKGNQKYDKANRLILFQKYHNRHVSCGVVPSHPLYSSTIGGWNKGLGAKGGTKMVGKTP
jgi:hypothetical protein